MTTLEMPTFGGTLDEEWERIVEEGRKEREMMAKDPNYKPVIKKEEEDPNAEYVEVCDCFKRILRVKRTIMVDIMIENHQLFIVKPKRKKRKR